MVEEVEQKVEAARAVTELDADNRDHNHRTYIYPSSRALMKTRSGGFSTTGPTTSRSSTAKGILQSIMRQHEATTRSHGFS